MTMLDKHLNLTPGAYILPTPAGAFKAVSEPGDNRLREFLLTLFDQQGEALITDANLCKWSRIASTPAAYEFVGRLQTLGWIQVRPSPYQVPAVPFQDTLPTLLPALSREGKILLADSQGFYLHSHGFPHEAAEELSALSAEIATLHARRAGVLNRNLGLNGSAWALTNAAGHSQLGFWPLFVGSERFVLVISGAPAFNQPQLVELAFVLHKRFGMQP